jgi:DNA-binding FrmR family transcriptional regulator
MDQIGVHTPRGYHEHVSDTPLAQPGYHDNKADVLKRLRRIEGQVRGLQRMVDEDAYCIEVLTQVSAATRALQSVAVGLLDQHLRHCVADAAAAGERVADDRLHEATQAIERLVRS